VTIKAIQNLLNSVSFKWRLPIIP